ncbi:MAG: WD40/YVTN/BNR-like repeat-containing protein [Acidobacteriota bacterium]
MAIARDGSAIWASASGVGGESCDVPCGPWVSVDHGATWSERSDTPGSVSALGVWVDREDPAHVLLGVESYGVVSTIDGGQHWRGSTGTQAPQFFGGPVAVEFDQAVGPHGFFVATMTYIGHGGLSGGSFRSFDGGLSWIPWSTTARPLAFQPVSPGRIVGSNGGAVFSDDGGATWNAATGDIEAALYLGPVAFSATRPAVVIALGAVPGPTADGIAAAWRSLDGGATWRRIAAPPMAAPPSGVLVDPLGADSICVLSTTGELWASADSGATWNRRSVLAGLRRLIAASTFPPTLIGIAGNAVVLSTDGGATWQPGGPGATFGAKDVRLDPSEPGHVFAAGGGLWEVTLPIATGCSTSTTALCLNSSRFRVELTWTDFQGNTGSGQAVPLTSDSGYFWFFAPANVELVVKVLDERAINDSFWVFFGALSNVEYRITVTDTETGRVRFYLNPLGRLASVADTSAFPGS